MSNKAKVINITESNQYSWNDYYETGCKILAQKTPHHIDVTLSKKKTNNRRSLNIDIFTEPGVSPLKYIAHMVPYPRKYEVFSKLPDKQLQWSGWEKVKNSYTLHKDSEFEVQYGKVTHRVKNPKLLDRKTVPHCAAGVYYKNDEFIAHLLLFDKEYTITLDNELLNDKVKQYYMARGYHTERLDPPLLDIDF